MRKFFEKNGVFGLFVTVLTLILGLVDGTVLMAAGAEAFPVGGDKGNPESVGVNGDLDSLTTRRESPDLIEDTVLEEVTKIRPYIAPLTSVINHAKSRKAGSMEFGWYSVDTRSVSATVTAFAATAADARGNTGATLTVDNAALFAVRDTIYVPTVFGSVAGVINTTPLACLVVAKNTENNTITVAAINGVEVDGEMSVPNIPADTKIYRMAKAAAEGEMKTASRMNLPKKSKNFAQIFKFQVSQTTIQKLSDKEVKWELPEQEEQGIFEFKMEQEASALFGVKGLTFDPVSGEEIYTTGGIVSSITNKYELDKDNTTGAIPTENLVEMCKFIFQGNSGSKKRLMFAGSNFTAALSKVDTIEKQVEAGNTVVAWGIEWKEIRTNFGTLLLMQHDMFDLYGYSDKAVIIDPDFVDKYTFIPMKREELDTRKSGEFDGDVVVFTEVCGYALRYPSCHCIVELGQ